VVAEVEPGGCVAAEVDLVVDVELPQPAISTSATTTVNGVCGCVPP
jgi:hypothetical protein